MFSLIRLMIFTLVAFAAGVMFEKANTSTRCQEAGGIMTEGLCAGVINNG